MVATHETDGLRVGRAAADLVAAAREAPVDALADLVSALSRLGDPAVAGALAPLAEHADPQVRVAVAQALGRLGDSAPSAVAALIALSRDRVEEVRSWATFALADDALREASGVPEALVARLEDPAEEVRIEAVRGLAGRGDPRAVDTAFELAPSWSGDPTFLQAIERLTPP